MSFEKAYTLVEVLVSLLIMLVILMGLLYAMSLYSLHSLRNLLRLEAVKIAQTCAETLRNGGTCPASVEKTIRNLTQTFNISVNSPSSSGLNPTKIVVSYSYKGKTFNCTLETIIKE